MVRIKRTKLTMILQHMMRKMVDLPSPGRGRRRRKLSPSNRPSAKRFRKPMHKRYHRDGHAKSRMRPLDLQPRAQQSPSERSGGAQGIAAVAQKRLIHRLWQSRRGGKERLMMLRKRLPGLGNHSGDRSMSRNSHIQLLMFRDRHRLRFHLRIRLSYGGTRR